MAERKKIGLREVRELNAGTTMWDTIVSGFGIRRQNSTAVAYIVFYRTQEGRQRWHTIGRHGAPWTPDTAREKAKEILGAVAAGKDPAAEKASIRKASTVAELCDLYMEDAAAGRLLTRQKRTKKESTLLIDKGRIARHIKPLLGNLKVAAVTSRDIENFMHNIAEGKTAGKTKTTRRRGLAIVRGGKGAASRAVGLLGGIFTYAVRQHMRSDNPVRGVIRYADGKRDRRLSDAEYKKIGETLLIAEAEKVWPAAVSVIRFLMLTGWRKSEALELRWQDIDLVRRTATLPDTKTGRSIRPLPLTACTVLEDVTRRKDTDLVFQASRGDGPMVGFSKICGKVLAKGGLPDDITPHVFRHSFISVAADLGYSELTIGAMVGHKGRSVTSRYVHSADAVLLAAADIVANKTIELMGNVKPSAEIVPLRRVSAEI